MVNDLPVPIHEVDIFFGNILIGFFQKLLDAAVIHIYQKDALHGISVICQFHTPAQRNDPVITVGRIVKEVLYMGDGKMKVFQLAYRILKPLLPEHGNARLDIGNRRCCHQLSVTGIAGNADKIVLIGLVKKIHLLIQSIDSQILILNDTVIHGIGDPPHVS